MMLRPGPVTMGHFLSTPDGWRMLITSGRIAVASVPSVRRNPRTCASRCARLRISATLLEHGIAHHVIVAHDDVCEELEMVAYAMGVQKLVIR